LALQFHEKPELI